MTVCRVLYLKISCCIRLYLDRVEEGTIYTYINCTKVQTNMSVKKYTILQE